MKPVGNTTQAELTHVTMSFRDMTAAGIRFVITKFEPGRYLVRATVRRGLFDVLETAMKTGIARARHQPNDIGEAYASCSYTLNASSFDQAIREVRRVFGQEFVIGEPVYAYTVTVPDATAPNDHIFLTSISDLVPGTHNYLCITTPSGYATNLARAINAAYEAGRIPQLTRRIAADTNGNNTIYLELQNVDDFGDGYLDTFKLLMEQMTA